MRDPCAHREQEARAQVARLDRIRAERDDALVATTLEALRAAAAAGENVMPAAMDAVEAYASVREVCRVLREVLGTYQEPLRF